MNGARRSANPRPGSDDEQALFDRVARWTAHDVWDELTSDALREIAAREGIDFATALLYERLRRSPEHGPLITRLEAISAADPHSDYLDADVVIVPGAFYREYPHTGADGRLLQEVASQFGCASEVIPLASFGSLAQNARAICDWLAQRPERPMILMSLSKGGADVQRALVERDASHAFRHVHVWLNLCGLVHGTPLVAWIQASRLRTWWYKLLLGLQGFDFEVVRELTADPGGPLAGELRLPAHMQAIHVVGFPLQRHLTNRLARRCFRRLAPLGPNDGSVLLGDVCRLPGAIYPLWGADHYLRPTHGDVRSLAARLLRCLCEPTGALCEARLVRHGGLAHAQANDADRPDLAEGTTLPAPGRHFRPVAALHATDTADAQGAGPAGRARRSHLHR